MYIWTRGNCLSAKNCAHPSPALCVCSFAQYRTATLSLALTLRVPRPPPAHTYPPTVLVIRHNPPTSPRRRLARTIRRARWLNLIPWHEKLHPKLRFSSLKPDPLIPSGSSSVASSSGNTSGAEALDSSREERFSGPDRGAAITGSYAADVNAALAEINRIAAAGTDSAAQR